MKRKWLFVGLGVFALALLGALAAITVPNILKYRYKSKQAEAKYMLKVLLTKQQEHRAARGVWATHARDMVEFMVSGPRSSTCFMGDEGWGGSKSPEGKPLAFDRLPDAVRARLKANDAKNGDDLYLACAVNLDEDLDLDVWVITLKDPVPSAAASDLSP